MFNSGKRKKKKEKKKKKRVKEGLRSQGFCLWIFILHQVALSPRLVVGD